MRAAIYARVSTERQERQQTIDSQLTALRAWAVEQGHTLAETHVYRDEGYSGSRLDRPGLDGLRDAIRDAAVDVVAVFSPDRLARKYAYQVLLLEEFRRASCEVIFLHRPISDDPSDQLLLQIQGDGSGYIASETRRFAREIGLEPRTTPIESPQSNGMAEAFVRTIKRDYVRVSPRPDAETVLRQLPAWLAHYNEVHPHKALGYRSPREFIEAQSTP